MIAILTITPQVQAARSLRAWLLCRLAGIDTDDRLVGSATGTVDRGVASWEVPCLQIDGIDLCGTWAIGEYLHGRYPDAGLLPTELIDRARCRSVCDAAHSGFPDLHAGLPLTFRARSAPIPSAAALDINRISTIWADCLDRSGGPYLFGESPSMADAMFAPDCLRFRAYDITLTTDLTSYRDTIWELPPIQRWITLVEREGPRATRRATRTPVRS